MADEKKKGINEEFIETIDLSELREGSSLFHSEGISYVKITKSGIVKRVRIPIKSSGVSELIDDFRCKAPTPPIVNIVIRPDDPAFRELKLTKKQHVRTFDFTDSAYLEAKEKYESELGLKIVLKGLNFAIKDKDGNEITDDERKIKILQEEGLTGEQFTQLAVDIRKLTKWEEETRDDFLQS